MKKYAIIIFVIATVLLSSCGFPLRYTAVRGSGNLVTERRRISGIRSVDLISVGTLIIEQSDEESLEITAEDNFMDYLESNVIGSKLSLDVQEFIDLHPTEDIIFYLKVKDLSDVEIRGSGSLEMDELETDDLSIDISGSGKGTIETLNTETLNIDISGSGKMDISGNLEYQNIRVSGSGYYNASDLYSNSADADISGSGNVVVWVMEDLNLELSGSGKMEYYGEPLFNCEVSGSGTVQSLGAK